MKTKRRGLVRLRNRLDLASDLSNKLDLKAPIRFLETSMSKAGSSRLRKALFFPAMSAMRYIPLCRTSGQRLKEKGRKSIVVIGAILTKLLHLIFGILRSGKPFNPTHLQSPETA
jgi:transposase